VPTGIPHEQEIPAPVTTTIFLLLTTESEISKRVLLVEESVARASRLRVTVIVSVSRGGDGGERGWEPTWAWLQFQNFNTTRVKSRAHTRFQIQT